MFFSVFPYSFWLFRGKLERERREKQKQHGLIRLESTDTVEDMERERRNFQLQMCEVYEAIRGRQLTDYETCTE